MQNRSPVRSSRGATIYGVYTVLISAAICNYCARIIFNRKYATGLNLGGILVVSPTKFSRGFFLNRI